MSFIQSIPSISLLLLSILLQLPSFIGSAKILMIPMSVKSHVQGQTAIAEELVKRNHTVLMFYPSGLGKVSELVKAEKLGVKVEEYQRPALGVPVDFEEVYTHITKMLLWKTGGVTDVMRYMQPISSAECVRILEHNEALFEKLAKIKFDIAVIDGLFMMKCMYLIPHRLGIPWITHTDVVEPWLVKAPWIPSFVPLSLFPMSERMNFLERVQNFFFTFLLSMLAPIPSPPAELMDKYRKSYGNFYDLDELVARSLLFMTSRHLVSDYAKPMMPNMVDVGGLTIQTKVSPLTGELAKFVEESEKGVILVTFGTMAAVFPADITQKFVAAFERLGKQGYRVVWRFEAGKSDVKLPANVWAANWLPQNDLLAHEKIKAFVTHGGNNGQMESIYHAKPMIGFPLNGDQPYNVRRMHHKGYGIEMDIHDFTVDQLVKNLLILVSKPNHQNRISLASKIFRSEGEHPKEKAARWIEHIIRFGGNHLKSAGNELSWHQYWMLDILAVVFFVILILTFCLIVVCRYLILRCCCSATAEAKVKTN